MTDAAAKSVRHLGVHVDADLSLWSYKLRCCFVTLRQLRQVRRSVTDGHVLDASYQATPCLKKLCKIVSARTSSTFHQFRKMANRLKLCEMHSFSTSPNLRHHTTVLNADVPNCYTTLQLLVLDCSNLHHQFNRRRHVI